MQDHLFYVAVKSFTVDVRFWQCGPNHLTSNDACTCNTMKSNQYMNEMNTEDFV